MTKLLAYKLLSRTELLKRCDLYKKKGFRIVFTNGCFDIIHAGHIDYLKKAKARADIFVVGLNSDSSVAQLKGPQRPIHNALARAAVLSHLDLVDWICIFEEETPIELIKALKPAIHVKGGDYKAEELPEYPIIKAYGGQVVIEPFLAGYSTTAIVEKLQG